MAYRRGWRAVACATGLVGCGIAGGAAWRGGLWGSLTGAVLVAIWLAALTWWLVVQRDHAPTLADEVPRDVVGDRLVLDAAPTPMVMIEGAHVRVLNRAARRLFAADDRVVPAPAALIGVEHGYLRHEGRQYRIDRVMLDGVTAERSVAALIDVEQEERVAEARATAEMIHVLGHELLNGLAPIVSLAESGETALDRSDLNPRLLREILSTLARRAEGLQRFTEGYRELARLPPPHLTLVSTVQLAGDLKRLFMGRWPNVEFDMQVEDGPDWPLDRDQIGQALWAVLQNAAEATVNGPSIHPQVRLEMRYVETELFIAIRDNGCGVAQENVKRIFRPFHTTKRGGTGVGLSLARQIAHGHGGELSFVNGDLTTFLLRFPIRT